MLFATDKHYAWPRPLHNRNARTSLWPEEDAAEIIWRAINIVLICQSTFNIFDSLVIFRHNFTGNGKVSCILATYPIDFLIKRFKNKRCSVVFFSYQTKHESPAGDQFQKFSRQRSIFGRIGDQWVAISSPASNDLKWKSCKLKMQNHWLFSSNNIYFCMCQKTDEKKSKEDEQTLKELNSAHHRSQAKCQLAQTSYIKWIKLILFLPYNKHLINRVKSVCIEESWPQLCVQTWLHSFDLGQDSPIKTSCLANKS